MKNLLYIVCFCSVAIFAQPKKDTSYTVLSTYKKELKKYPFIKITKRKKSDEVKNINDIVYKTINGRVLQLDAYFNSQNTLNPIVLFIHGGGWKSGDKSQMVLLAQQIAAQGYSCFCVEYRLSDEAKFPASVFDIKTAIKFIKSRALDFNADASKVAVLGCSSGGQMAALIGTTNDLPEFEDKDSISQNTRVQAIIDVDGILAFHHPESEEGKMAALWLNGSYEENPMAWEQASPLSHCGKNTPPILFINSDKPRFHAGRDDMIGVLKKYKIYNEVRTIEGSPHSFWFFDPWFDEIVLYTTQFLDKIFKHK